MIPSTPRHSPRSAARASLAVAAVSGVLLAHYGLAARAQAPVAQASAAQAAVAQASAWGALRSSYDYAPLMPDADFRLEHIALLDGEGKAVPGLFMRPKAAGTYPVVMLLHGLTSDKETMIQAFGRPLAAKGFAVLALDAREHGERKTPGVNLNLGSLLGGDDPTAGALFAAVMKGTVGDYRRALDYLETRRDVDSSRVGLLGYSMGAMMGAILSGVDQRVGATVLEVGGDPVAPMAAAMPEAARPLIEAISPSRFVGHIAPRPVLMINAKSDTIMSADAAKRLQDAAREPKQVIWAPGGHILAAPDAMRGVAWLTEKLSTPAASSAATASAAKK